MATTNGITDFVRYLTLGEDRRDGTRNRLLIRERYRVIFDTHRRELYSYGHHFPLARFVPAKRGRSALWVINGDRWRGGGWTVTPQHQDETRRAIADAIADAAKIGKTVSSIIIPFSALDGAGIDRDSIRPIFVRDDWRETFDNTATMSSDCLARPLPSREDSERVARASDPRGQAIMQTQDLATLALTVSRVSDLGRDDTYALTAAKLTRWTLYRGMDYSAPREDGYGHGAFVDYDPPRVTYYLDGTPATVTKDGARAVITWQTSRHWLGDSVFTAERVTVTRERCQDHRGTRAADSINVWCDTCGQLVTESGDAPTVTRERRKRMRFVSSFDYSERMPLYFLAALPRKSRAVTVDMAIEDLAPPAVHAAYARGLAVKRQGDIFAIPTALTDADVYARAQRRTRLYLHTHDNGKPRAGEVGFRVPMSEGAKHMAAKRRREGWQAKMREHMSESRRPSTPSGWHAEKRRELAKLTLDIARHERRISDGADVCGHGACGVSYNTGTGEVCATCNRPRWYDGYSVANAERSLAQTLERYAVTLAAPRWTKSDRGYTAKTSDVWNGADQAKLTDGNRARATWQRVSADVAARFAPSLPHEDIRRTLAIYGTAHTATEVAVCARNVTYIRGTLRHVPAVANERRGADHAAVPLDGARWYLAVRNTVPRQ